MTSRTMSDMIITWRDFHYFTAFLAFPTIAVDPDHNHAFNVKLTAASLRLVCLFNSTDEHSAWLLQAAFRRHCGCH